ncbi:MAG: CbiX/SirB N-terminal domain-containing protein [Desulfuromonadaceae bacterium]|nr:CbiX/SirB N-terminal domain-containing protein [Desulfuromonadaceae bacterium]
MNRTAFKTAILLVGHGSPRAEAKSAFCAMADLVRASGDNALVEVAFLSCGEPSIASGIDRCVAQGARRIVLCPYFLFAGRHVSHDLPAVMAVAGQKHPEVELLLAEPLGVHAKLAEVACERIAEALGQSASIGGSGGLDGSRNETVE